MGVERLTDKDLQLPEAHPKTKGPEWPVEGPEDFNCLHCRAIWEPDEQASMTIQTGSAVGEIVIVCPKCGAKSVLCPEDDPAEGEKGHVMRQLDEAMSKEEWRAQWRREAEEDKKREAMNPTSGPQKPKIVKRSAPPCNGQVPRQKYGGAKTK